MVDLNTYGWNDELHQLKQNSIYKDLSHARITIVHRTCYEVVSEDGIFQCELTGNLMFGKSGFDLPSVGDWVIIQSLDDNRGIILDLLPRQKVLYRRKSGTASEKQAITSHVDKAFIVQSIDDHFNLCRIERFMVQIVQEDIKPILILNKADLNNDRQKIEEEIRDKVHQMPVYFTSIHQPETVLKLKEVITEGETVVFVGSSGVGKSSLVNVLIGKEILLTGEISTSTGKGKHTSTRREMIQMEGSGIIIDTPGVREFGLAIDDPEALTEMLDISHYAGQCRFTDCHHINEPDCAVLEAVRKGSLAQTVYDHYLKLQKEAWHFYTSDHEKRKKGKSFSKILEEVKKRKSSL
ncbi:MULTISPECIES: ribosome small subunit-dependent GTPase A [unclassified Chryseobacterium]|uniref:ribosome small subunit-dependent GTPase A n=1 Tax=unclassified Chryseobacterium TaxID=2593645 RepID=UPI00100AAEC5|nr:MULTISPECIES: ribosome small subunit-dependent GTPase A [unclassified Chryseobacterium]RXM51722.1 ribosome small subunit-dependent GTPase A [Chryseobacterium sp. CH25]RXM67300.1 ribosome small subunit-dependent GTPase A [Chryseobacterium sp. CH1]